MNYKNSYDYVKNIILLAQTYYKGNDKKELTIDSINEMIEKILYIEIVFGRMSYAEDAPEYLKIHYPQLFLDDNAPDELKQYFYDKEGSPMIVIGPDCKKILFIIQK